MKATNLCEEHDCSLIYVSILRIRYIDVPGEVYQGKGKERPGLCNLLPGLIKVRNKEQVNMYKTKNNNVSQV
jgi:hypothetical protein